MKNEARDMTDMDKKEQSTQVEHEDPVLGLEALMAQTALRPTVQNATTIRKYCDWLPIDIELMELVKSLTIQTEAVIDGDMSRGEAMLTAQAHSLDAIANNLMRRAMSVEHLSQFETYLKLGLRAQTQCRATWESISTIKYPKIAGYVRQANIANGPQQVNNEIPSRAREKQISLNKLLEEKDHESIEWVDSKSSEETGQIDWVLEAVDEIDGPAESGW